ncbi:hypothetical protein Lal_00009799 [Lupinus albus]|uniref:Uncharacterized protein n=1 Tax=Lupinus albus TaxID=3870 RepID=A0A6A4MXK5_LUPAL|nr:hypothetical protein Lalb_Chr24g0393051 [Lupinus albus]KAF1859215.1 hypothetical protein Lal_00009799 [Lupinus albus]
MKSFNNITQTKPLIKLILISSSICIICLLVSAIILSTTKLPVEYLKSSPQDVSPATNLEHLVFGLGSGRTVWPKRKEYVTLYWKPNKMRGCVFVGTLPNENNNDTSLPPLCLSSNTSKFRYTWGTKGHLSANRMARMVKDMVDMNYSNVRWYVFGDDDTIFFPENLVKTLYKYDHRLWYYLGAHSESYLSSQYFGFGMAFGGGGFAISSSLAKVLAKVIDSCLERYHYLYGSDARTYSCITELGVRLTNEPGFHQVDMRSNIFGLLAAHPVTPLLSLHHPDLIDPIFPNMTTMESLQHLFEAANVDSQRILQQSVCYHKNFSWTISVSWGYAIQVFPYHLTLPEAMRVQLTNKHWTTEANVLATLYNYNTISLHPDPCKRSIIFYLDNVSPGKDGMIISNYRTSFRNCSYNMTSLNKLEIIKVFSKKLDLDIKQLQSPRRHCCDILPPSTDDLMEVAIRECKDEELIFMQ